MLERADPQDRAIKRLGQQLDPTTPRDRRRVVDDGAMPSCTLAMDHPRGRSARPPQTNLGLP